MSDLPEKKFGAPTKFKPEYCQMLIDHMTKGYSFEAFAGRIGTSKRILYIWAKENDDFFQAKEIGFEKSRFYWETLANSAAMGRPYIRYDEDDKEIGHYQANTTLVVFNLKNRFPSEWRDRHEIHASADAPPETALLQSLLRLTPEQLEERRKEIVENEQRFIEAKAKAAAIDVDIIDAEIKRQGGGD